MSDINKRCPIQLKDVHYNQKLIDIKDEEVEVILQNRKYVENKCNSE